MTCGDPSNPLPETLTLEILRIAIGKYVVRNTLNHLASVDGVVIAPENLLKRFQDQAHGLSHGDLVLVLDALHQFLCQTLYGKGFSLGSRCDRHESLLTRIGTIERFAALRGFESFILAPVTLTWAILPTRMTMRYLILVLAMVLGCAAEGVEPTVQIGGYSSDIGAPDIQGADTQGADVQGTDVEGTDVAQPDVQDTLETDVEGVDIQVDTQPDVQVDKDVQDAQVDVQDAQPDVQIDTQPDTQQPDVQDVQAEVQVDVQPDVQDVQDTQVDTQSDTQQPDVQPDVQVDTQPDVQTPKDVKADTGVMVSECEVHSDCTDAFQCTVDTCVDVLSGNKLIGICKHTGLKFNCDDGNSCTIDQCGTKMGECLFYGGGTCTDGNACTTDTCIWNGNESAGCKATPVVCDDELPCTTDTCDPKTGCKADKKPVGTTCNDGELCGKGACTSEGICKIHTQGIGTAQYCVPPSASICNVMVCDGGCKALKKTCDDNSVCTVDSCDDVLGCNNKSINCDDGFKCTADSCNKTTGCKHTPIVGCKP